MMVDGGESVQVFLVLLDGFSGTCNGLLLLLKFVLLDGSPPLLVSEFSGSAPAVSYRPSYRSIQLTNCMR